MGQTEIMPKHIDANSCHWNYITFVCVLAYIFTSLKLCFVYNTWNTRKIRYW